MRILVTGGGGFLGGAICKALLSRGDAVVACQRSPAPRLVDLGAECVQGDLQDLDALSLCTVGCNAVIHTAGKAGVWGPYETYHRANVIGTQNVIEACRANDVPYLVYTSSPSVVHSGGDIEGGDESLRNVLEDPGPHVERERIVLEHQCDLEVGRLPAFLLGELGGEVRPKPINVQTPPK